MVEAQGVIISASFPRGCCFGAETWPHTAAVRLQCWIAPGQTTNRVGTQHHHLTDRLPKVPSPQPPLSTSLPTRYMTSLHPPGTDTSPSRQCLHETMEQPHPRRGRHQEQEELQSCSLRNGNHKQKIRQNEAAMKYGPDLKITRKTK